MKRSRTLDNTTYGRPAVRTVHISPSYDGTSWLTPHAVGTVKSMEDNVVPNFKKLLKMGRIVLNDMSLTVSTNEPCEINFVAGPWSSWYHGGYEQYFGDFAGYIAASAQAGSVNIDTSNHFDRALAKAYAKMNSAPVLGGEILSDLSKTLLMLRRPFSSSITLLNKMLKKKRILLKSGTYTVTKAAAQAWLEYRYGWKPIILDCNSVADEVQKMRLKIRPQRLVARASVRGSGRTARDFDVAIYGTLRAIGNVVTSLEVAASAGVMYEVKPSSLPQRMSRLFGFRLTDVPATLWEITPWSFVVDWFTNVGDWIQAVTPNPDVEVLGNWVTQVDKLQTIYGSGRLSYTWNGTFTGSYPQFSIKQDVVKRTVNAALSTHPVAITNSVSLLHGTDGLALAIGRISSMLQQLRH